MATEKKSTFKGSAGINDGGEVGLGDDERVGDELIYTKAKTLDELETAICAADENRLTIVHFVDKTGKGETEGSSELMTLLQNSRGVGSYIIVDDPRICVRLAVTYVPHLGQAPKRRAPSTQPMLNNVQYNPPIMSGP